MNPDLEKLHAYPFQKLAKLREGIHPPAGLEHISLSIGEPKHKAPSFIHDVIRNNLSALEEYPKTAGSPELRETAATWLDKRFQLQGKIDPNTMLLPVNGTREGIFSLVQAVVDRTTSPVVAFPNPFYQIYEGASLLAGAEPAYLPCLEKKGFLPDLDSVDNSVWERCQLLFLCSPGNPTGAVMPTAQLQRAIELANRYNFLIAADECYSELYFDEEKPPPGLLQAAIEMGHNSFRNCLVLHSLSKRSNLPGLRSGFVAGDPDVINRFLLYRTYHGCAMSGLVQQASIAAWQDEDHVVANRELYCQKFSTVVPMLQETCQVEQPQAGFYLWIKTSMDDREYAKRLYEAENITVLPGQFLGRDSSGQNPGKNRIRIALVAPLEQCIEAANRINRFNRSVST